MRPAASCSNVACGQKASAWAGVLGYELEDIYDSPPETIARAVDGT
jgi:hypothetical protein